MARAHRVLLVSPHPADRDLMGTQLREAGYEVHAHADPGKALADLAARAFAVVVCDEDLGEDQSGLEFLYDAREVDPEASLVLLASEADDIRVAADALNRCGVCKIIVRPWQADDLVEDLFEAAEGYRSDTRRNRRLALSRVRVSRLDRDRRRLRSDLRRARRLIDDLSEQVEVMQQASVEQITALPSDVEAVVTALFATLRAAAPEMAARSERVAQLAVACATALGWPAAEVEDLRLAAIVHHLLLPAHEDEDDPLTQGPCEHAATAGRLLGKIPAFESIAEIVARHHDPLDDDELLRPPRAAQLLQLVSAFETAMHRDREEVEDLQVGRAHATVESLVKARFSDDLFEAVTDRLLPPLLGRRERRVPLDQVQEGMVVSRPVLAGQLSLVASRTQLSARQIERLCAMDGPHRARGLWVETEEDAQRTGNEPTTLVRRG